MNGGLADGKLDLFVEAKVVWVGEIHADTVAFERGGDDTGDGFKTGAAIGGGDGALDVAGKTAGAVAAHFGSAAVVVIKIPGPVGFALAGGDEEHKAIGADTALAMADLHDIVGLKFDFPVAIIDENEVVSRPVHLCETNDHQLANVAGRGASAKWICGLRWFLGPSLRPILVIRFHFSLNKRFMRFIPVGQPLKAFAKRFYPFLSVL